MGSMRSSGFVPYIIRAIRHTVRTPYRDRGVRTLATQISVRLQYRLRAVGWIIYYSVTLVKLITGTAIFIAYTFY